MITIDIAKYQSITMSIANISKYYNTYCKYITKYQIVTIRIAKHRRIAILMTLDQIITKLISKEQKYCNLFQYY